jgi:hypothetical protein
VWDRAQAVGCRIAAGEHREHAGAGARIRRIDFDDPGMRMWRTHDACVGLAGQAEIGGVSPGSDEKSRILAARHRFSDALRRQPLTGGQERHRALASLYR